MLHACQSRTGPEHAPSMEPWRPLLARSIVRRLVSWCVQGGREPVRFDCGGAGRAGYQPAALRIVYGAKELPCHVHACNAKAI